MSSQSDVVNKLNNGESLALDARIKGFIKEPLPTFRRVIVMEVISDPFLIDDNKFDYYKNVLKVTNIKWGRNLPRNTIIGRQSYVGTTKLAQTMFYFPFFPSHLSLPCKPGEMVWAMIEDPNAEIRDMGYWICRIAEPHNIDDVNHTHHAGQLDHDINPSIKKLMDGNATRVYELRNGKTQTTKDGIKTVLEKSKILPVADEEVFEKLITQTDASALISYEPIPRFKKRPGDVVLEGSNNTLISLGTDRTSTLGEFDQEPKVDRGVVPTIQDFKESSGTIDIVAGRGNTPRTSGLATITKRLADGNELKKEISKFTDDLSPDEGDPDLLNDSSRILVSQRTMVDKNFGLKTYMEKVLPGAVVDNDKGDAGIVIRSDKVRIIARSDISFIVTNYVESNKKGLGGAAQDVPLKINDQNADNWASITIKKNGDIVFTPSQQGFIKLGGDDAIQAVLCSAYQATSTQNGIVTATPIATTAGGFVGTFGDNLDLEAANLKKVPDLGTFSKKVLIK